MDEGDPGFHLLLTEEEIAAEVIKDSDMEKKEIMN
jgi:hypothetical protein